MGRIFFNPLCANSEIKKNIQNATKYFKSMVRYVSCLMRGRINCFENKKMHFKRVIDNTVSRSAQATECSFKIDNGRHGPVRRPTVCFRVGLRP